MLLRLPKIFVPTFPLALGLLAGCNKPVQTNPPSAKTKTTDLFEQNTGAPTPVASAKTDGSAIPATTANQPVEPDWQKKFYAVATEIQTRFKTPEPGSAIALRMLSGSQIDGSLVSIDESSVTLVRSNAQMKIPADNIAPESRITLFAQDYGRWEARRTVSAERAAWLQSNRTAHDRIAANAKPHSPREPSTAQFPVPPVNEKDGTVPAVLDYLHRNLRDPDSLLIRKWGRVEKDSKDGWRVTCQYDSLGGDFGKMTENKWFFINETGSVFQTAAFKEQNPPTPTTPRR